jgi:hypothetical protein
MKNTQESNSLQDHCICHLGELFLHKEIERNSNKKGYKINAKVASIYILPSSLMLKYNGFRITR